jgi:hypothetical protein
MAIDAVGACMFWQKPNWKNPIESAQPIPLLDDDRAPPMQDLAEPKPKRQ